MKVEKKNYQIFLQYENKEKYTAYMRWRKVESKKQT